MVSEEEVSSRVYKLEIDWVHEEDEDSWHLEEASLNCLKGEDYSIRCETITFCVWWGLLLEEVQ